MNIRIQRHYYRALFTLILLCFSSFNYAIIEEDRIICQVYSPQEIENILDSLGATIIAEIDESNLFLLRLPSASDVETVVEKLSDMPEVEMAQPNYIYCAINPYQISQPFVDYDAPPFQEGVSPEHYYQQYSQTGISIDAAHQICRGENILIAIIDGGLDNNHPIFYNHLSELSYDFVSNDAAPWVSLGRMADHGTFVAGIVARSAPEASLMILKSFNSSGNSTSFRIAQSISYAVEHGARVINMSFGMDEFDPVISKELDRACENNVLLVAAAGNEGQFINKFPAGHDCVVNVTAVDSLDKKADFSNYWYSVSLTAPGVNVYGPLSYDEGWGWWGGTSFAAPFVSGLAALAFQAHPEESNQEIINRIRRYSINIDDLNSEYISTLGDGRIVFPLSVFVNGDIDSNLKVNLGDVVFLINHIYKNGPSPVVNQASDNNCDLQVNVGDAVFLINYIFRNGPSPGCD
ncbi:MAG: S8 family serine peptidase [candidate division Zixibacteria bacterium]